MMQYTTDIRFRTILRVLPARIRLLAFASLVALGVSGHLPEVSAGWVVCPPVVYVMDSPRRHSCPCACNRGGYWRAGWRYVRRSWRVPLCRSIALHTLWLASGRAGAAWIMVLPWASWVWQVAGVVWPGLSRQPEWWLLRQGAQWCERGLLWAYGGLALGRGVDKLRWCQAVPKLWEGPLSGAGLLLAGPVVTASHDEDKGCYAVELQGHFRLCVGDDDRFRLRLLILFLRLLEAPEDHRGGRRTRDGRTPFVRQELLAGSLGVPQPDISRWEGYWLTGDWRRLLSQRVKEVLTLELQQTIIDTWAHWPSWSCERVYRLLVEQGVCVSMNQVRQAAQESGWQIVRRALGRMCVRRANELRLNADWLLGDLLAQLQELLDKVEMGQGLTPEEQLDLAAWRQATQEAGLAARVPEEAHPWLQRVEQMLFHPWEEVTEEGVRCPECGSTHVGRKGLKPRLRKVVDGQGREQKIEVYRYRCHNRACGRDSFTVLPPGLVPYSPHPLEVHVLALQMYAWGRSTYRLTSKALGVASTTTYRWVSAFGYQLLPVAALFGVVKSSGVVGVDEKWVQVPKNNKPQSPRRKWMYVYLAVDAYTYDLLHIAIYPYNTKDSAQVFLLALRAKGYHPRAIVTDLRPEYGEVIAQVFPKTQHHECLFHASQWFHQQLAEIYGWEMARSDEEAIALRQAFDHPLVARTKRTAQRRYDKLMAQRDQYVKDRPELGAVFDSLAAHWPTLLNGIESKLISRTNNTVELVIRRFDQHYQNFCGFNSLETAQRFLNVFEKVYRFTPFSDDAQPRVRGKSPLQLAGYDVEEIPMAAVCSGWTIVTPPAKGVPNR